MAEESRTSNERALIAFAPALTGVTEDWQPILQRSNQVVLYNPTSHALSIHPRQTAESLCPYCTQPLPPEFEPSIEQDVYIENTTDDASYSRASNYFQLLAIANDTSSRPSTPSTRPSISDEGGESRGSAFAADTMAEGYFKTFFKEERRLGMGANGTVFLCQHVLDGNPLGHFAIKKIAVGESHSYLLNILREVRLLERFHHPNIITYHHSWLESCKFSPFGPKVPTLHVLMQWAEGGSLDDYIDIRLGRSSSPFNLNSNSQLNGLSAIPTSLLNESTQPSISLSDAHSRSARIRAFRAYQRATPEERMNHQMPSNSTTIGARTWTAVHLLSAEEVASLFSNVVEGLAFLHDKSILHLDLKPGNVLLTWDEGALIPRAMLSDFGTSRDMLQSSRTRSGNTGTLEYTAPESLPSPQTGLLQQVDSKADMWSLGMILHKMLFFKLPYRYAADGDANVDTEHPLSAVGDSEKMDRLEQEVQSYTGFKSTQAAVTSFEARRLPRSFLVLLESLLNINPSGRPSCERVLGAIREGRLDPLPPKADRRHSVNSVRSVGHRRSSLDSPTEVAVDSSRVMLMSEKDAARESSASSNIPDVGERIPLLGLPPPEDEVNMWARAVEYAVAEWNMVRLGVRFPRFIWIRTFKSCVLAAKVLTMMPLLGNSSTPPVVIVLLLPAAIIDTWFDGILISLILGTFHLVFLWIL